jgi:hypothetical protein
MLFFSSATGHAALSGVVLEGEAKERYNAIQQQLAQLSTKFSNNVLDATKVGVLRAGRMHPCRAVLARGFWLWMTVREWVRR